MSRRQAANSQKERASRPTRNGRWGGVQSAVSSTIRPYQVGVASLPPKRLQEIRLAAEQVAREEARGLASFVRRDVAIEVVDVVAGSPSDDDLIPYAVEGQEHDALGRLLFTRGAIVAVADLLMGGLGTAEDRAPTELESQIVAGRMASLAGGLVDVVQGECGEVTLVPVGEDSLLLGDQITMRLALVAADERQEMAFAAPIRRPITSTHDLDLVARTCAEVPVTVSVRFQPVTLAATAIASLGVGDVLCLEHDLDQPVVGTVDGQPLLLTRIGRTRHNVAVEIVDLLDAGARAGLHGWTSPQHVDGVAGANLPTPESAAALHAVAGEVVG